MSTLSLYIISKIPTRLEQVRIIDSTGRTWEMNFRRSRRYLYPNFLRFAPANGEVHIHSKLGLVIFNWQDLGNVISGDLEQRSANPGSRPKNGSRQKSGGSANIFVYVCITSHISFEMAEGLNTFQTKNYPCTVINDTCQSYQSVPRNC